MKRFVLPALLFLLVCCKKAEDRPPSVTGTWELRRTVTPWWDQRYSAGNDTLLKFTNNHYEHSINGQIKQQGTYRVIRDKYMNNEMGNRIIYDNDNTTPGDFYWIRGDELSFFNDPRIMDGGGIYYQRIK